MNPATAARSLPALLLLGAVVALPGCRSDGGFGRKDNAPTLAWTLERFAKQVETDWKTTTDGLADLPGAVARDFRRGVDGLQSTYWLYVEGNTHSSATRVQHSPEAVTEPPAPGSDGE